MPWRGVRRLSVVVRRRRRRPSVRPSTFHENRFFSLNYKPICIIFSRMVDLPMVPRTSIQNFEILIFNEVID